MFEMLELILDVAPDLISIGDVLRSARNDNAEFEQKLAVMTVTTLAQHQNELRLRHADDERGTAR